VKNLLLILCLNFGFLIFGGQSVLASQPNSDILSQEWGLHMIEAPMVWSMGIMGKGITVAVIDTGIDGELEDLSENLLPGYNAITNGTSITDTADSLGHGTRVASLIAGNGQGLGFMGVAPEVKILPIKVLDGVRQSEVDPISKGIKWAADHGANIINMSLGSPTLDAPLQEAIKYAQEKGCLIVAAAGNHAPNRDSDILYPGSLPGVVTVGALSKDKKIAAFSNIGSSLDLIAPGTDILAYELNGEEKLVLHEGTSIATPFVSGVAALVWSAHPNWSAQEVASTLEKSALPIDDKGRSSESGFGLVNAYRAIRISELKTQIAPTTVDYSGAQVKEHLGYAALTISPLTWNKNTTINLETVNEPAPFESNILPSSPTIKVTWDTSESPHKILALSIPIKENLNYSNYLYHWDGTRWLRIGGGDVGDLLTVNIYKQGLYRVGQPTFSISSDLSGLDSIQKAIKIADEAYPNGSSAVFLARNDNYLDYLTVLPLAYKLSAPILFTSPDTIDIRVKEEIEKLAPQTIYLLGDTEDIPIKVEQELSRIASIYRLGGKNQYQTAIQIAKTLGTEGKAFIVNGENLADAFSIASIAAQEGIPILLTNNQDPLPIEMIDILNSLRVTDTLVIGGNQVISDVIFEKLPSSLRIGGFDRYDTNQLVNTAFPMREDRAIWTNGEMFFDAFLGNFLASVNHLNLYYKPETSLYLGSK